MTVEKSITIVMGSGDHGAKWAQGESDTCFSLDKSFIDANKFISGDSFNLPFKDNSIDNI